MDGSFSIQGAVWQVLRQLGEGAVTYAPKLVTAAILVAIGWIVAKLLAFVVGQTLHRAGLNAMLEKAGLLDTLAKVGIADPARGLLPQLLYWLTMLVFVQSAAEMAGMTQIAGGITAFFAYLPNVFSAAVILLAGQAFGQFLARAVTAYAKESGLAFARSLGNAVSGFVLFVVAIMALGQLQVDTRILNILTIVIFAGLALGFGLTFGLGTRDTTRNMIAGFYARRLFGSGQRVEIAGQRGTLRSITAMQTVLDADGTTIALPNSTFLEEVIRREEAPAS